MSRRLLAVAAVYSIASGHRSAAAQTTGVVTKSAASACAPLASVRLPDVRITQAVVGPEAGAQRPAVRVPHCRVTGVIGRDVDFVLVLPETWNERLTMPGNGGYAGAFASLANANNGYATVTTNTGHIASGVSARWALNDLQRQQEFGYLAVHQTIDVAKALVRAYYGSAAKFAYFIGCSNGGRQALIEAQRYPEDFDGIVAGAPAYNYTAVAGSFVKNLQAVFPAPGGLDHPTVTQDNLKLLAASALAACDANDGVADGVIDDPRKCSFKLSNVKACPTNASAADCLTAAQRAAIERVYAPTMLGGRQLYPGQPVGGESDPQGWQSWITGDGNRLAVDSMYPSTQSAFAIEGYKYFLTGDTAWNYLRYDLANVVNDTRASARMFDAVDPNLSRFASHGGKLLMYHGWADPALNALATIEYYERVLGADQKATSYLELYMLPGVLHCGGGAGPSQVAWLDALRAWREESKAPARLVATNADRQGRTERSRPICPYPQRAIYSGSGSTDDEANFACRSER